MFVSGLLQKNPITVAAEITLADAASGRHVSACVHLEVSSKPLTTETTNLGGVILMLLFSMPLPGYA
jgi:hypothetical protein